MWKNSLNLIANVLLFILIIITLLGVCSELLFNIVSISRTGVIIFDVLSLLLLMMIMFRKKLYIIYKRNISAKINIIFAISLFIIGIWQLYLVLTISGFSKWDPGNIILQAMEKKQWAGEEYFSYYPNTYFLMLLEHVIWYLIGKPNIEVLTIVLNILNYLLIDSGIYTLYRVSKKYINLVVAKTAALLSIIFIGISPWGCLTYSDPLAFSLSIFSISLLLSLRFSTTNRKYMYSVLIGFLMVIDYLIKPSLVILFIAAIIVTLPLLKKLIKSERLSIIIIAMTVMASYGCYLAYRNNNSFVTFDSSKSFSMTHFADMGIKNNGGYSQEDTVRDMQILDSKERQRADIQDWVTEFNRKGLTGF